jgi:hypothetical protein
MVAGCGPGSQHLKRTDSGNFIDVPGFSDHSHALSLLKVKQDAVICQR